MDKIEKLLQPSTKIRMLQWIWQTATSQPITLCLGKRMVLNMMTEMIDFVFPPRSAPTWVHFTLPHFSNTNKTKTSKVYPKYWPTKTEPFGSTSISLYEY